MSNEYSFILFIFKTRVLFIHIFNYKCLFTCWGYNSFRAKLQNNSDISKSYAIFLSQIIKKNNV